eukprot:191485-Ditylum_brightwellii.AAC.1
MACTRNPEIWDNIITILTPVFKSHKVDPILQIVLLTYIQDPGTPLNKMYQKHPYIKFRPYQPLLKAQQRVG